MTDDDDEARWVTVFYEDGSVETVERPGYAESLRQKEWDAWGGGPPIPEVTSYNAGHELTRHARDVASRLTHRCMSHGVRGSSTTQTIPITER